MNRFAAAFRRVRAFFIGFFDPEPESDGINLRICVMDDALELSVITGDFDDN